MTEQSGDNYGTTNKILKDFNQRFLDQMLQIYVISEVEKRIESGRAKKPMPLYAFQIIFRKDEVPVVRLNEEVSTKIVAKIKSGEKLEKGVKYGMDQIERIEQVLFEPEDGNEAHFSAILKDDQWHFTSDFRFDKKRARKYVEIGNEFMDTAMDCLTKERWRAFVENAWIAAESYARAELILTPLYKEDKSSKHNFWIGEYGKWAKMGNTDKEFSTALHELFHQYLKSARYQELFSLKGETATRIKITLMRMQDTIKKRIR